MAAVEQVNFIHKDENWRQRVTSEVKAQKGYDPRWGYLVHHGTPTHLARPYATCLTKYFNPRGGTWTVREKRVPEKVRTQAEALADSSALDSPSMVGSPVEGEAASPTGRKAAAVQCRETHQREMAKLRTTNNAFITSSSCIGQRSTLEQFGVAQYGRASTITLQDVYH